MGYVLPILGELAYTANLNIDYIAAAPLHQELRVTASLRDRADRKLWIEARGESADGIFVRAEALFLAVDRARFANHSPD
jgi:acyl-CoA thioesterase FadM